MSAPVATPFSKKFETVAPVKYLFLNKEISINPLALDVTCFINNQPPITVTANNVNEIGLVQPKSAPRVIKTFKASITKIKKARPVKSNLCAPLWSALLSGTSLIKNIDNKVSTIENTKIQ